MFRNVDVLLVLTTVALPVIILCINEDIIRVSRETNLSASSRVPQARPHRRGGGGVRGGEALP